MVCSMYIFVSDQKKITHMDSKWIARYNLWILDPAEYVLWKRSLMKSLWLWTFTLKIIKSGLILKEKKSIFRLSISSVDIALFSLIRGREKSFEKWDPWVLSIFFPWNQHTQKHVVHIFPFRFNWVCIVLGRKPRRLCLTRHYAVDMVAALFVQVRRLRFCFHKVTKGYLLLYSDSHFKRPFKYSCIRTYCSNVKTRYSFFQIFWKDYCECKYY